MKRFRTIEFWPSVGHPNRRWSDEPETDAWARSATRVSELYGQALESVALRGMVDSMRLVTVPDPAGAADGDAVRVEVHLDRPGARETASVRVPPQVADLSPSGRARLVLDVIHAAVSMLAPHRDWSLEAIEEVRGDVLGRELPLTWSSPWEASPDGSHQARALFRHADDAYGRVALEIRAGQGEEILARSAETRTFSNMSGFKRAASTLRWVKGTAELVPYWRYPAHRDEALRVDPSHGVAPLAPREGDLLPGAAAALRLEVVGTRGALALAHVESDGGSAEPTHGRGAARVERRTHSWPPGPRPSR